MTDYMSKSHGCFARDSAMDVASARGVSSHPLYYGKPMCSSQSSLIRISRDRGSCFGRMSFRLKKFAAPNAYFTGVQWCNRSLRWDPYKFNDKKSHRLSELARTITVRSDLAGAAKPESCYPKPVKIEGLENLPSSDTPAVYVSNHQSFLDIYTLLSLGKSFKFISKTGIFVIPIIGWAMFMMGVHGPKKPIGLLKTLH